MPGENTVAPEPLLTIQSRLEELALVWPWVEAQAEQYEISADSQFAIQLCLEEALSNIIRHGYGEQTRCAISIHCAQSGSHSLIFTVEDQAPPFDPLAYMVDDDAPAPASIEQLEVGGQGIRLLRKFAGKLDYQRIPNGNRLIICFPIRK
jgi:anti-sigma regulatory factor (Ser/Thr protein kinase)